MIILLYNILAMSIMINLFILIYSVPKLRREKEYWRQRCTWHERYIDDLIENDQIKFDADFYNNQSGGYEKK